MADSDTPGGAPDQPSWRVLAHPLRSRIVAHLRLHGGATASDLARALGTHTGATSYHVRALESAGLVEDTGLGDGRSRVWALVDPDEDDDLTVTRAEPDEDDEAMAGWLAHDYLDHFVRRSHAWVDRQHDWAPVWQDECGLRDELVLVSEEQLTALRAELDEVIRRYRRVGAGTPGARRVAAYSSLLPVDQP